MSSQRSLSTRKVRITSLHTGVAKSCGEEQPAFLLARRDTDSTSKSPSFKRPRTPEISEDQTKTGQEPDYVEPSWRNSKGLRTARAAYPFHALSRVAFLSQQPTLPNPAVPLKVKARERPCENDENMPPQKNLKLVKGEKPFSFMVVEDSSPISDWNAKLAAVANDHSMPTTPPCQKELESNCKALLMLAEAAASLLATNEQPPEEPMFQQSSVISPGAKYVPVSKSAHVKTRKTAIRGQSNLWKKCRTASATAASIQSSRPFSHKVTQQITCNNFIARKCDKVSKKTTKLIVKEGTAFQNKSRTTSATERNSRREVFQDITQQLVKCENVVAQCDQAQKKTSALAEDVTVSFRRSRSSARRIPKIPKKLDL